MPGLLDPTDLSPDFLDPSGGGLFNSPEYRRQRIFDTLGGIGAALMSAGSRPGADVGSSLAAGLAGGVQAGMGTEDRFLKRMMTAAQLQQAKSKLARNKAWQDLFSGGGAAPSSTVPASAAAPAGGGDVGDAASAIAAIESGGKYDALGPVANSKGNRAYGKYQVMDFNVGPWTEEVLGKPMSPQEFLANPQAQDAVFKTKFGQYMQKYGSPQAASRAWFAGEGGMNNPDAADVNGMTVSGYEKKFSGALPVAQGDASGNPVQLAQAQPPAFRPQTMQEVVQTIPPGVRQMLGAMGPEQGMGVLMKYADPGSEAVLDTQSGQVVFIPKTMVGRDPRYQPVESERLNMDRQRLGMDKDRARRDAANAKVVIGPGGQPAPNPTVLDYEKRLKAMEDEFKQAEEKRKKEAGQSEKSFTQEKAIRNEYESQPQVKAYREVVPIIESVQEAVGRPTRAADLNLIYGLGKIMDPNSVVREGEMVMARGTGTVQDYINGLLGQLNGGQTLTPETRQKLVAEMMSRVSALKESNDALASQYGDIARAYGLDPSRVVIPIRMPGRGPGGSTDNQPTQDELKGWASGAQTGGVRLQYVPGKGVVPR